MPGSLSNFICRVKERTNINFLVVERERHEMVGNATHLKEAANLWDIGDIYIVYYFNVAQLRESKLKRDHSSTSCTSPSPGAQSLLKRAFLRWHTINQRYVLESRHDQFCEPLEDILEGAENQGCLIKLFVIGLKGWYHCYGYDRSDLCAMVSSSFSRSGSATQTACQISKRITTLKQQHCDTYSISDIYNVETSHDQAIQALAGLPAAASSYATSTRCRCSTLNCKLQIMQYSNVETETNLKKDSQSEAKPSF